MLHATKLNYSVSFYQKIKDVRVSATNITSTHKEFFSCDRKEYCKYVAKFEDEETYRTFESEDALANLTNVAVLWKKGEVRFIKLN